MISEAIKKVVGKGDLTYNEAYEVMNEIMSGNTTPTQNAAYLAALSTKSSTFETIDEIFGSAVAMRDHALKVDTSKIDGETLEIVGTGGDHAGSINISTTAAFIISAAGVKVAKHGNRAASSKSGAADCLEALGVNLNIEPDKAVEMLNEIGICFFFAQKYHTSMKYVGAIRRELGIRTVFNILGPLTNPANPQLMLLGVYSEYLLVPIAKVLQNLGVRRALVVYGQDKLDEISISAPTGICELDHGIIGRYVIEPEDFGLRRASKIDIVGGTPQENAQVTLDILNGAQGPKTDIVLLNAAAALYVAEKAKTISEGLKISREMISSGKALNRLNEFVKLSQV